MCLCELRGAGGGEVSVGWTTLVGPWAYVPGSFGRNSITQADLREIPTMPWVVCACLCVYVIVCVIVLV